MKARKGGDTLNMRPEFLPTMSVTEFKHHYWYTTELREICRKLGLECTGTKAELTSRVEHFLSSDVDSSSEEEELRITMTDTTLGLVVSHCTDSYTELFTKVVVLVLTRIGVLFVAGCLVSQILNLRKKWLQL